MSRRWLRGLLAATDTRQRGVRVWDALGTHKTCIAWLTQQGEWACRGRWWPRKAAAVRRPVVLGASWMALDGPGGRLSHASEHIHSITCYGLGAGPHAPGALETRGSSPPRAATVWCASPTLGRYTRLNAVIQRTWRKTHQISAAPCRRSRRGRCRHCLPDAPSCPRRILCAGSVPHPGDRLDFPLAAPISVSPSACSILPLLTHPSAPVALSHCRRT